MNLVEQPQIPKQTLEYFTQRMAALGIDDDSNNIGIIQTETSHKSPLQGETVIKDFPIFTASTRGIDILVYTLERRLIRYAKDGGRHKNHIYKLTRLFPEEADKEGKPKKYNMPSGQGTHPFIPPHLVQKYEAETDIPVLYLTEGYFKAMKAAMHGIDCIGFPSITLMTEKETHTLYQDVKTLIESCNVERIVWLMDGDCMNLTKEDIATGANVYERPAGFAGSVKLFYDLVSDYKDIDKYFAHLNSDTLETNPKGLDDLLISHPSMVKEIAKEFNSFSKKPVKVKKQDEENSRYKVIEGRYLTRITLRYKKDITEYFHLNDVDDFYTFYSERDDRLQKAEQFNYRGNYFSYDQKDGRCKPSKMYPPETQRALELVRDLCYVEKLSDDGDVKRIGISMSNFNDLLYQFGFRRFDIDRTSFIIVRMVNNVLSPVAPVQVQDMFFKLIAALPEKIHDDIPTYMLKERFVNGRERYFSAGNLSLLKNDKTFTFCKDGKDEVYIFYKNGYVRCNGDGWKLYPMAELSGCIWQEQVLSRSFTSMPVTMDTMGCFQQFFYNVCGKQIDRYHSLCTMMGYILHSYFDVKRKALILTDSEISDNPSGRTGKGLLLQAMKRIKPTVVINGKDFKTDDKHKYQEVTLETQIVGIDDAKRNVQIEDFFNDIVEGLKVEKKNQAPFKTDVKMVFTTNKTIRIEGASAKDRVIEFEMANHYSDKFSPQDEFGKWFFTEFDDEDWQAFDNFICFCISLYLDRGIIGAKSINLERRKLIDQTNEDFVNWIEDKVTDGTIAPDVEYDKKELHLQFLTAYPEYKERSPLARQRRFTECLKTYANYAGKFAPFNKQTDERRSHGKDLFIFRKK